MSKTKKNFELGERYVQMISRLKVVCDLSTEKEVIEEALVLLGWSVARVAEEFAIGAYNTKTKEFRQIAVKALLNAGGWEIDPNKPIPSPPKESESPMKKFSG